MSMKDAVLALVVDRRGYGYELQQRFEQLVGPAYRLSVSAIYHALEALERESLVRVVSDQAGLGSRRRGVPRLVYEATPAGADAYHSWIGAPAQPEPLRGDLTLKVACARPEHAPALLAVIDGYERACVELLQRQLALAAEEPPGRSEARKFPAATLARERSVRHLNAEIEWLRDLRRVVEDMDAAAHTDRSVVARLRARRRRL